MTHLGVSMGGKVGGSQEEVSSWENRRQRAEQGDGAGRRGGCSGVETSRGHDCGAVSRDDQSQLCPLANGTWSGSGMACNRKKGLGPGRD